MNSINTCFIISNTFISNARLKLTKHFYYLKIICFLHPRYHPKIIGDILKNTQKTSTSV